MNTSNPTTTRGTVVVGVDGSPQSEHAVVWAAEEAHLQGRPLTLVHAQTQVSLNEMSWLSQAGIPPQQVNREIRDGAQHILEHARALATDIAPDVPVETFLGGGDARKQLLELAPTASLVVVGSRGHGPVVGLLLGSVSSALVRHSQTPVAVVRTHTATVGGVLLAADGSEESLPAVEEAYREAAQRHLPLTVGHCLWDGLMAQARWAPVSPSTPGGDEARRTIAETLGGMAEKYPDVKTEVLLARGAIDAFVVDLSQRYDLLVIGRPPRSLGQRLTLSGLTTSIAEHAHSPVIVVP